ncbi:MAG: hypothetical protein IKS48_08810 [Eubacterium sp.]|nr:hypothetical protein [Eubacterium sp.]
MRKIKISKIVSIVLCVLFCFSFFAESLSSVEAAATEYMYVIDSTIFSNSTQTLKYKYSYNKNGFVSKMVVDNNIKNGDRLKYTFSYTYKNGLVTGYSLNANEGGKISKAKATYTYDSKKRLKKVVTKGSKGFNSTVTYAYDKNNNISKMTEVYPELNTNTTYTYKYNKKNQVTKQTVKWSATETATYTYKYDKKGTIIEVKSTTNYNGDIFRSTNKRTITYNSKGLVTKIVQKDEYDTSTAKYKYKKIKINKKFKKEIEKNQKDMMMKD